MGPLTKARLMREQRISPNKETDGAPRKIQTATSYPVENYSSEDLVDYLKDSRISQAHSSITHVHVESLPNVRSTATTSTSLKSIIR